VTRRAARRGGAVPSARRAAALLLALALAPALGACSAPHPAGKHSAGGSARPSPASTGQLGSTLAVSDSNGTELAVTLEKVIDPASGASKYAQPTAGHHFVGVKLRVRNKATTSYQNNANNETTIILSDGKTQDANYNPIAGCGNFDNGQVKLKSGTAKTGCVTFQVPNGQRLTAVRYGNTVFPGVTAQWRLAD
jgi:hypothetical protein